MKCDASGERRTPGGRLLLRLQGRNCSQALLPQLAGRRQLTGPRGCGGGRRARRGVRRARGRGSRRRSRHGRAVASVRRAFAQRRAPVAASRAAPGRGSRARQPGDGRHGRSPRARCAVALRGAAAEATRQRGPCEGHCSAGAQFGGRGGGGRRLLLSHFSRARAAGQRWGLAGIGSTTPTRSGSGGGSHSGRSGPMPCVCVGAAPTSRTRQLLATATRRPANAVVARPAPRQRSQSARLRRAGQAACENRFGRISAPFPPAVAHRLLLSALSAAIE